MARVSVNRLIERDVLIADLRAELIDNARMIGVAEQFIDRAFASASNLDDAANLHGTVSELRACNERMREVISTRMHELSFRPVLIKGGRSP